MIPNNPANEITNSSQLDCKAPSCKNIWVARQMYNPGRNVDIPKRPSCPPSFGYQSIQTIVWMNQNFSRGLEGEDGNGGAWAKQRGKRFHSIGQSVGTLCRRLELRQWCEKLHLEQDHSSMPTSPAFYYNLTLRSGHEDGLGVCAGMGRGSLWTFLFLFRLMLLTAIGLINCPTEDKVLDIAC